MTEPRYQRTCPACGKTFQANCPESVCENFYCSGECAGNQPTDFELMDAMRVVRMFMVRRDDGTLTAKPGLEMLLGDAKNNFLRLRATRTTWVGAGELQVRMVCDKFIEELGIKLRLNIKR